MTEHAELLGHCPVHPGASDCRCCRTNIEWADLDGLATGMGLWMCTANGHREVGKPMLRKGSSLRCAICGSTLMHIQSGIYTPRERLRK